MTIVKLLDRNDGFAECRCCLNEFYLERAKPSNPWYVGRFAWGSFTRPPCGCTQEMLRAKQDRQITEMIEQQWLREIDRAFARENGSPAPRKEPKVFACLVHNSPSIRAEVERVVNGK